MHKQFIGLLLVLGFMGYHTMAQVINPASSFRDMNSDKYFRFHYDNDYFTKMDYYYSQGINLEFVHPVIKHLPFTKLLIKPAGSTIKYGIALDHVGYTPTSIRSNDILYGDRPFAATITLKTFVIAMDSSRGQRISTAFIVGLIGPGAFGEEMQTGIHRWLKNVLPLGWQYQVKNDIILNYQFNYERKLFESGNVLLVNGTSELRVGTMNDKLSLGFNFMAGQITKKKFRYYVYGQPMVSFVGYDATLQGGLFNKTSPYTIRSAEITRITAQADAGVVVQVGKLFIEYSQSVLTREFSSGHYHRWGGVRMGIAF
jgi:hypothetical protein